MPVGFSDILISTSIGFVLSLVILVLGPMLSKHKKSDLIITTPEPEHESSHNLNIPNSTVKIERRIKKLQKILGRSEDDVRNEICKFKSSPNTVEQRKRIRLRKLLGVTDNELSEAIATSSYSTNEENNTIPPSNNLKNLKKLQEILGVNEDQVREAIRKTRRVKFASSSEQSNTIGDNHHPKNINSRTGIESIDEPYNWARSFDFIILAILIGIFCFCVNKSTDGNFGRIVAAIFPREFGALGLKEYLERLPKTSTSFPRDSFK